MFEPKDLEEFKKEIDEAVKGLEDANLKEFLKYLEIDFDENSGIWYLFLDEELSIEEEVEDCLYILHHFSSGHYMVVNKPTIFCEDVGLETEIKLEIVAQVFDEDGKFVKEF